MWDTKHDQTEYSVNERKFALRGYMLYGSSDGSDLPNLLLEGRCTYSGNGNLKGERPPGLQSNRIRDTVTDLWNPV